MSTSASRRTVVTCPCGKKLKAPHKPAGSKVKCPACGIVFALPDVDEPTARTCSSAGSGRSGSGRHASAGHKGAAPRSPDYASGDAQTTCAKCGEAMPRGAGYCVSCGYNTVSTATNRQVRSIERDARRSKALGRSAGTSVFAWIFGYPWAFVAGVIEASMGRGADRNRRSKQEVTSDPHLLPGRRVEWWALLAAAGGGLASAVAWAFLSMFGYAALWVAWLTGLAVGSGADRFSKSKRRTTGIACVIITALSILIGKTLSLHYFTLPTVELIVAVGDAMLEAEEERFARELYKKRMAEAKRFARFTSEEEYPRFMTVYASGYTSARRPEEVTEEEITYFRQYDVPRLRAWHTEQPDFATWQKGRCMAGFGSISEGASRLLYDQLVADAEDFAQLTSQEQYPEYMATHRGFRRSVSDTPGGPTEKELAFFKKSEAKWLAEFHTQMPDYETWCEDTWRDQSDDPEPPPRLSDGIASMTNPLQLLFAVLGLITAYKIGSGAFS